jgi:hypothetical protein
MTDDSVCTACGTKNHCPCPVCVGHGITPKDAVKWVWKGKGHYAVCGKCGKVILD